MTDEPRALRPAQAALEEVIRKYAITEGEFTLASGRTSSWYLVGRNLTFRGDCLHLVGDAVLDALAAGGAPTFDTVGGIVVGAVPVALAVAERVPCRAFAVRKEAKDHGDRSQIAGPLEPGDRVLIVEDTTTTGGSLLEAVDAVEAFGCEVVAASVLVDRGGELGDKLAARGIPYFPVLTAPDLGYAFGS